ncbi:MAG: APC family permease [Solirubrobacteraceae bacterium]|jgi:amino acid transporter
MEATTIGGKAPAEPTGRPELKRGAISYLSNIVIGVASTAPGYSLAATIGFIALIGGLGPHTPAVIIVSFLPMLCIALAYKQLNTADPDCGTTFSWMSRAMGAGWGWVGGFAVLFADIVVNANQAQIAGSYGFQLFGLDGAAASTVDVTILGVIFIAALTWICWRGIELSARTQQFLLGFEMVTLVIFAVVALLKVYTGSPKHAIRVRLDWFNPFSVGFGPLVLGLLLGVFLYWGWDSGVSVNEETEDSSSAPGRAAVVSNLVLIGIFLLVSVAAQAYSGTTYLAHNANDIFAGGLARNVLGPLHFLLTIAVLTSATAATQTTILPAARSALSMARRGAIPARFGSIHERNLVPGYATIVAGVLSVIWFVIIVAVSTNVLADCVTGLGFLVSFYYGFTGFACVIFYRRELMKSVRNFFVMGVLPAFGGLVLMGIFVKGFTYYANSANDSSPPLLGLGVPDWIGILGIVGGIALMLARRATAPGFFQREKRMVWGDPIEVVTPEAEFAPADSLI